MLEQRRITVEAPAAVRAVVRRSAELDAVALDDLEDEELRLLALAVGDHLPIEIHQRIEALRARRRTLAQASAGARP